MTINKWKNFPPNKLTQVVENKSNDQKSKAKIYKVLFNKILCVNKRVYESHLILPLFIFSFVNMMLLYLTLGLSASLAFFTLCLVRISLSPILKQKPYKNELIILEVAFLQFIIILACVITYSTSFLYLPIEIQKLIIISLAALLGIWNGSLIPLIFNYQKKVF